MNKNFINDQTNTIEKHFSFAETPERHYLLYEYELY
jgi:hypothetical protein